MAITYTVNDIKIVSWMVDTEDRKVTVNYNQVLDTGLSFTENNYAVFWETMPVLQDPQGNPLPPPANWYQLPAKYSQVLTDLTIDARNALMHLVNPV